jgi:hypothetical protein
MKDISLHLLDILQNSVVAGATEISVEITEDSSKGSLELNITDNGKGMDAETLAKVTDAFFTTRTTRKVGLGLPLLKQNAERTGGCFSIASAPGNGSKVEAVFCSHSMDMLPLGDVAGTLALTISSWPAIEFRYEHKTTFGEFSLKTTEMKIILDGLPLNNPEVIKFMKEMITENLLEISAGEYTKK